MQNSFNQTFGNAVRATGSDNVKLHLVVQACDTGFDLGPFNRSNGAQHYPSLTNTIVNAR